MDRHDLHPDAQRVVELAREARTPRAADKRRVRRAVAVGLGALAVSATTGVATSASAVGAGLLATLRVVATVVLVTTAGAGTAWWAHARKPLAPPAAGPALGAASVLIEALAPLSEDPLVAELALLRDAQQALRDGHAARALALAQRHATLYPRSQLRLEGEGLEIFALCALGRQSDAHRLAAELLARAPRSPLRASLAESCALPPALPAPRR